MDQKKSSSPQGVYEFAKLCGELKQVERTGWTHHPWIKKVESVADHSWRMGMLVMLFSKDSSINLERCLKFAIIHDLAEVIVGDITPRDGIPEVEKHAKEEAAMKLMLEKLSDKELRDELFSVWKQYEDRQCVESKLVKDMDRYEMLLQAFEYEQQFPQDKLDLREFFEDAKKIVHPVIKEWLQELLDKRDLFWKKKNEEIK